MSHLANLLRQVVKKSSHPNALVYKMEVQRATQKHLVRGELADGEEDAVALGAPAEDGQDQERKRGSSALEMEKESGSETTDREGEGAKRAQKDLEDEESTGRSGSGGKDGRSL